MPPTVADLIATARRRAGLSQAELGRRAGVAQSVVSAYENGHRRPSLEMAARLVSAAGARLVLDVVSPADPDDAPVSVLGRRVRDLRSQVLAVASRYGASNVRLFGSVARGQDGEGGDVDLLVDLRPGPGCSPSWRCRPTSRRCWTSASTWCRPPTCGRRCARRSSPRPFRCEPEGPRSTARRAGRAGRHRRAPAPWRPVGRTARLQGPAPSSRGGGSRWVLLLLAREPQIPWKAVTGMRDHLAHRYVDTSHAIVAATLEGDLPPLRAAVERLLAG